MKKIQGQREIEGKREQIHKFRGREIEGFRCWFRGNGWKLCTRVVEEETRGLEIEGVIRERHAG